MGPVDMGPVDTGLAETPQAAEALAGTRIGAMRAALRLAGMDPVAPMRYGQTRS